MVARAAASATADAAREAIDERGQPRETLACDIGSVEVSYAARNHRSESVLWFHDVTTKKERDGNRMPSRLLECPLATRHCFAPN